MAWPEISMHLFTPSRPLSAHPSLLTVQSGKHEVATTALPLGNFGYQTISLRFWY